MDDVISRDSSQQTVDSLPAEVLAILFCYLDENSKRMGRLVAYKWRRVLDAFFLKFTVNLTDRTFETVLKSGIQCDTILVRNFRRDIGSFDELQSKLKSSAETVIFKQNNPLFHPEENPSVIPANVLKLIKLNCGMQTLIFEKNTLTILNTMELKKICLPNLTYLEIHITEDENLQEKTILKSLLQIQMPNLANIHINSEIGSTIYDASDKQKFYFTLFETLAKFQVTLKFLTFINSFGLIPSPTLRVIRLNAPAFPPAPTWQPPMDEINVLRKTMADIKLKEFSFMFPQHEGYSVYTLGYQLLGAQNQLSKLEVNFNPLNRELFLHVERAIQRCSRTLKTFNIINQGFYLLPVSMTESILRSLGNCSELQSLKVNGFNFTNLRNITRTLKIYSLEINGRFDPSVLMEITVLFPSLKYLVMFHNDNLDTNRHSELARNLKILVGTMPKLERLTWKLQKFDLNFLNSLPSVSVRKAHQFIDYYSVQIKRNEIAE